MTIRAMNYKPAFCCPFCRANLTHVLGVYGRYFRCWNCCRVYEEQVGTTSQTNADLREFSGQLVRLRRE
jgi:transposase-like protein